MTQNPPDAAIVGTFDVRNYGDLLFPLVAAWRLQPHGIAVSACSPAGGATGWADTAECLPMAQLMQQPERHAAVLIGGGNIVHAGEARLLEYPREAQRWAYASLWLGATAAAAVGNIPVLWNAPGVSGELPGDIAETLVPTLLAASEYVSVRDVASRDFLRAPARQQVQVVPDTVLDLARMWPAASLEGHWHRLLERKAADAAAGWFAVHVKLRAFRKDGAAGIAAAIDAHAQGTGLRPLLVAIGPCHDDPVALRRVAGHLRSPALVLDDPLGLREIAASIAFARHYVGCSLHGYITAASYGRPGRIVALPALPKQAGFAAHLGREQDVAPGWSAAFRGVAGEAQGPAIPHAVVAALDAHWERIASGIARPRAGLHADRARFLRSLVRRGLAAGGPGWLEGAMA